MTATSPLRDTLTVLCDVAGSRFLHRAHTPPSSSSSSSSSPPGSPTQLTTLQVVVRVAQGSVVWRWAGNPNPERLLLRNIARVRVGLPHEMQPHAAYFAGAGHVFCLCTTRGEYMVLCAPNARKLDKWVGSVRQEVFRARHRVGATGSGGGATGGGRRRDRGGRSGGAAAAAGTSYNNTRTTRRAAAARSLFQDQADRRAAAAAGTAALAQLRRQPGLNRLGRKVLSALDPICHAASRGDSRAVQSIVQFQRPHASAIESALFLAASAGHNSCMEPLLRVSASFFRHVDGTTVMHAAVKSGNAACVRVIAQYYFDLADVADSEGNTPLHAAVKAGDANCLLALLQSAAETSTSNKWGKTPLALAREKRRKARREGGDGNASKIVRMLKDYGAQTVTPYRPLERSSEARGPTDMNRIMSIWNAFFENAMRWRMGEDLRENGGSAVPAAPPPPSPSPSSSGNNSSSQQQGRKHAWAEEEEEPWPRGGGGGEAGGNEKRQQYSNYDRSSRWDFGVAGEEKSAYSGSSSSSSSSSQEIWESCWDADTERWFWYNTATGASVWHEDEWSHEGADSGYDTTVPPVEDEAYWLSHQYDGAAKWDDGQTYETHYDEATCRWYYVNVETGQSMWADEWTEWDSTGGAFSAAAAAAAAAATPRSVSPRSVSTPRSSALLPYASPGAPANNEWETQFDESTQRYYYVSRATGESVWGDSLLDSSSRMRSPGHNISAVVMNVDASSAIASMSATALASSWEMLFDEATGHYYHSNAMTGESLWVVEGAGGQVGQRRRRQQQQQQQQMALALPAWQVPDAADPWDKVLDADSGRWYWVHRESGESVWADDTTSVALELNVEDGAWDAQLHAAAAAAAAGVPGAAAHREEDDEWDAFVDEAGNTYEISRVTGASRWAS